MFSRKEFGKNILPEINENNILLPEYWVHCRAVWELLPLLPYFRINWFRLVF
jgi:hypothetical protein